MEDLEAVLENLSFGAGDGNHMSNDTHIIREGLFHVENTGSHATVRPDEEEDDDEYYYETPKEIRPKKETKDHSYFGFCSYSNPGHGHYGVCFLSGKTVEVPDIKGKTTAEAKTALEKLDLVLEVEKEVYNAEVAAGMIITQNPESGKELQNGENSQGNSQ